MPKKYIHCLIFQLVRFKFVHTMVRMLCHAPCPLLNTLRNSNCREINVQNGDRTIIWLVLGTGHCILHHLYISHSANNTQFIFSETRPWLENNAHRLSVFDLWRCGKAPFSKMNGLFIPKEILPLVSSQAVSKLGYVHATIEQHQSSLVATSRPPLHGGLGTA